MRTTRPPYWVVLLLILSTCGLFAQSSLQVVWENSELELLRDRLGSSLTVGTAANGDGCAMQLGYYSNSSAAEPFKGDFVPIAGEGTANTQWSSCTMGDGAGTSGRFSFSTVFRTNSSTAGNQLPSAGKPLVIRFFDGPTLRSSTYYNAVSAGSRWAWKTPSDLPGELLTLSLGDSTLVWLGGDSSAFKTTLPSTVHIDSNPVARGFNTGESVVLGVSASGMPPITYQWCRNGVAIQGALSSTYSISSASLSDAGTYTCLASNQSGTVSTTAVILSLNQPPAITSFPSSLAVNLGATATLTVSVTGTAPFTYQWKKNGSIIPEACSPTLTISNASALEAGSYSVVVTNAAGSISSPGATISINPRALPYLTAQPKNLRIIQGAAANLSLFVDISGSGFADVWQLYISGQSVPLLSGTLSTSGALNIPLRTLSASGDYLIRTVRTFTNGETLSVDSEVFHLDLDTYSSFAGNYEGLVEDSTPIIPDGGAHRGLLNFTLGTMGSVSGRLRFNQPQPISNATGIGLRNYVPVYRSFTCALSPSADHPDILLGVARLAGTASTGYEELFLQLDLSQNPAVVSASYHSPIALSAGTTPSTYEGIVACSRLVTAPGGSDSSIAGRYTLASELNSGEPDAVASYLLLNVTSTGSVFWIHRGPGYAGTGAGKLSLAESNRCSVNIYEAQIATVMSAGSRLTRSWLGSVSFLKTGLSLWEVEAGSETNPETMEYQTSCVSFLGTACFLKPTPANWTYARNIHFPNKYAARWSVPPIVSPAAFAASASVAPMEFAFQADPAAPPVSLPDSLWSVNFSAYGMGLTQAGQINGVTSGRLMIRSDRFTGEYLGTAIPLGMTRAYKVSGLSVDPNKADGLRAIGWVEAPLSFPYVSEGTWTLKPAGNF